MNESISGVHPSKRYFVTPEPPADVATLGPLARYFWVSQGKLIYKWHHYFEIYEHHLEPFRGRPVRVLEIGVQNGGSLQMWRDYFGPEAVLFGIDIDEACRAHDGDAGQVRIGSQADRDFLRRVVDEMGGLDVVIDDGSHVMAHIRASFETLFPRLSDGGIYIVEDLHSAYWPGYGGGYRKRGTFIEQAKRLVDDMHHWYHKRGQGDETARDALRAVHFYDSVVVLEKRRIEQPRHSRSGGAVASASSETG